MEPHLLDGAAELNLGQSAQLAPGATTGAAGDETKLALLPAPDSKQSQVVTFHFASFTPNLSGNPGGPAVGVVEFSAGGAKLNRIEFDVPSPRPFLPNHAPGFPRRELNNGVSLSVVGAGFQALARNDGQISPVNDPTVTIGGGDNIEVSVHVGRFPLGRSRESLLRRSVYLVSPGGAPLAPAGQVNFGIPNYARSVIFPRTPMTETLDVLVTGISNSSSLYPVPAGAVTPQPDGRLQIPPDAFTMTVTNTGGNPITALAAVFDLDI